MISSLDNEKIKKLVKLQMKKYRDLYKEYVIEGEHLIEEALKVGCILEVFVVEGYEYNIDSPITVVSRSVMKKISTMDTPGNVIALCKKIINKNIGKKILLLDEIQDPGNLGTIIRSSVAFNIDTIILSENTVDLYNPKVLRATQGIYNFINIFSMDSKSAIEDIKSRGIKLYGTSVINGVDVKSLSDEEKCSFCLIVGNEGNGVRDEVLELCDKNLFIKMNENVESLNVGIATSIILYELGE